jgi:hypothetical protein
MACFGEAQCALVDIHGRYYVYQLDPAMLAKEFENWRKLLGEYTDAGLLYVKQRGEHDRHSGLDVSKPKHGIP